MSSHLPTTASRLVVDASVSRLLAYGSMPPEPQKIFIRVSPEAKARWIKMCAARGVKQQLAGERLFDWIARQNKSVQQAILNGGKVTVSGSGQHVTITVDAEEHSEVSESRVGKRPKSPAQSPNHRHKLARFRPCFPSKELNLLIRLFSACIYHQCRLICLCRWGFHRPEPARMRET